MWVAVGELLIKAGWRDDSLPLSGFSRSKAFHPPLSNKDNLFVSLPFYNVCICTNRDFLFYYVISRQLKHEYVQSLFQWLSFQLRFCETLICNKSAGEAWICLVRAVGSFYMVRGVWVKMLAIMVGRRGKILKKHWLKHHKTVPKNEIWTKI